MKIIFLLALPALVLGQSPDALIRAKAEKMLKENMGDPASYQFVSFTLMNKKTVGDIIEHMRYEEENYLLSREKAIQQYFEILPILDNHYKEQIRLDKVEIEQTRLKIKAIDSINRALEPKSSGVIEYTYKWRFRARNAFNALILNEYYVQVGAKPKLEILNIGSTLSELKYFEYPFPGKEELSSLSIKLKAENIAKIWIDSVDVAWEAKRRKDLGLAPLQNASQANNSSLQLDGWNWDNIPNVIGPDTELPGRIVYLIEVDENGELLSYRKESGTVSAAFERECVAALQKLTFTKEPNAKVPPISKGRITFVVRPK